MNIKIININNFEPHIFNKWINKSKIEMKNQNVALNSTDILNILNLERLL